MEEYTAGGPTIASPVHYTSPDYSTPTTPRVYETLDTAPISSSLPSPLLSTSQSPTLPAFSSSSPPSSLLSSTSSPPSSSSSSTVLSPSVFSSPSSYSSSLESEYIAQIEDSLRHNNALPRYLFASYAWHYADVEEISQRECGMQIPKTEILNYNGSDDPFLDALLCNNDLKSQEQYNAQSLPHWQENSYPSTDYSSDFCILGEHSPNEVIKPEVITPEDPSNYSAFSTSGGYDQKWGYSTSDHSFSTLAADHLHHSCTSAPSDAPHNTTFSSDISSYSSQISCDYSRAYSCESSPTEEDDCDDRWLPHTEGEDDDDDDDDDDEYDDDQAMVPSTVANAANKSGSSSSLSSTSARRGHDQSIINSFLDKIRSAEQAQEMRQMCECKKLLAEIMSDCHLHEQEQGKKPEILDARTFEKRLSQKKRSNKFRTCHQYRSYLMRNISAALHRNIQKKLELSDLQTERKKLREQLNSLPRMNQCQ